MAKNQEVDIREVVRTHIRKNYKTQSAAAEAWGISKVQLSRILTAHAVMPDWIAEKVGYKLVQQEAIWERIKKDGK